MVAASRGRGELEQWRATMQVGASASRATRLIVALDSRRTARRWRRSIGWATRVDALQGRPRAVRRRGRARDRRAAPRAASGCSSISSCTTSPRRCGARRDRGGRTGVELLTVHAAGGSDDARARAAEAARGRGARCSAVTVLTSLDADDLRADGIAADGRGDGACARAARRERGLRRRGRLAARGRRDPRRGRARLPDRHARRPPRRRRAERPEARRDRAAGARGGRRRPGGRPADPRRRRSAGGGRARWSTELA